MAWQKKPFLSEEIKMSSNFFSFVTKHLSSIRNRLKEIKVWIQYWAWSIYNYWGDTYHFVPRRSLSAYAYFQTEGVWVWFPVLWDEQLETQIIEIYRANIEQETGI